MSRSLATSLSLGLAICLIGTGQSFAANPVIRQEFVYQKAAFDHCHASTIVEAADGTLVSAWFGGTGEGNKDVSIWVSRRGAAGWSDPVMAADGVQSKTVRHPCWNPVLFQPRTGPLMLFFKVGPSPSKWWGEWLTSDDSGRTWKNQRRLPEKGIGPVKNKPIQLADGSIWCPSSTEHNGWQVHLETTSDLGQSWKRLGPFCDGKTIGAIQPSLIVYDRGRRWQMLCRNRSGEGDVWSTWSQDAGKTWSRFEPTGLPNPNAGTDAVTLQDGTQLLVYNHTNRKGEFPSGRNMLNVATSRNGRDWEAVLVLERDKGEYSYPAVIQDRAGRVHITYTWRRLRVRHVVLDPAKLSGQPITDRRWPDRVDRLASIVAKTPAIAPADSLVLRGGVGRVDITDRSGPVNDPMYARALVIQGNGTTAVVVTLDVVAIEEIGAIKNDFLPKLRARLKAEIGLDPGSLIVNVSHCHGIPCKDVLDRTVQAVKKAAASLVPVRIGVGTGHEDRVQENRRLRLKDGRELDVRRAYSLPPDVEVIGAGPIDPEIGILRLDRADGTPLAVVYNFAMHPIMGASGGGNTADITGFSSKVIEDALGHGAMALFVQGCGGDINPAFYKDVDSPRDAEPQGNRLGISVVRALGKIPAHKAGSLKRINQVLSLPRADHADRIARLEAEQLRLVKSLRSTYLNFDTFLKLNSRYSLSPKFPSTNSLSYLNQLAIGRDDLVRLDGMNRSRMKAYLGNVLAMESITRIETNLRLLRKHQANNLKAGKRTIDVEVVGLRVGDFVMVTFPGEVVCQVGLNIKKASAHKHTFVAAYTNGYIYYCPTAKQMKTAGAAQEDSECLLAPGWQALWETRAAELIGQLLE